VVSFHVSNRSANDTFALLGHYAASIGGNLTTFRENLTVSFSGSNSPRYERQAEDRNVGTVQLKCDGTQEGK
jgi:hypothetical protein